MIAPTPLLLLALLVLLIIVAFSSGTEVAMLSVNRYRHPPPRARAVSRRRKLLERLLLKPDDWLGANLVILAAASVFASAIATILAQRTGHALCRAARRRGAHIIVIVFCELAPKIYAAANPERVALHAAGDLPRAGDCSRARLLWLTNKLAYGFLRLFGVVRCARSQPDLERR